MYCSSLSANACIHYIINRSVLSIYSMKRNFKKRWKILKQLWQPFLSSHISIYTAASGFYMLLSLLPATALLLSILRFFPASISYLQQVLEQILPQKFHTIANFIFEVSVPKNSVALVSLWAILTLWTASRGIASIADGLSEILCIHTEIGFMRRRMEAMLGFVILSVILAFTLSVQIFGEHVISVFFPPANFTRALHTLRFLCASVLLCMLLTLLYRVLPGIRLSFRRCLFSGILSALSLSATSSLFSIYVNHFQSYQANYGGVGLLILGILWIQVSLYILLGSALIINKWMDENYRPFQIIRSAFGR